MTPQELEDILLEYLVDIRVNGCLYENLACCTSGVDGAEGPVRIFNYYENEVVEVSLNALEKAEWDEYDCLSFSNTDQERVRIEFFNYVHVNPRRESRTI